MAKYRDEAYEEERVAPKKKKSSGSGNRGSGNRPSSGKKPSGTEPEWKCEADASHYYHGFVLGLQVSWIFRF